MSTAAAGKPRPAATGAYEVARPQGKCSACGRQIEPDEKFMTALRETPVGFERIDSDLGCWSQLPRQDIVAFWQTVMPRHEQKKKLFVDDEVLGELFERLAEVTEPAKVNFRFVLGLILMRKRLLIYESTRTDGEREVWLVRLKGREATLELINPRLGEEQVMEVSQQLGEILNQEL